ncbi:hypothetical protein CFC35_08295 [Streptomyces sp. FBKL.4005]|uniref:Caspase family protein n=1 Tax=Streptomyces tricolor TaxID=68277 RepID=A0ABS9JQJ7_9ACTN|nr:MULTISPECIES: caspase family protein [Streptomyces]MCG0067852.1 caspase family protein [Streptomyces tricolor]OYP14523.1 hypothetical protein CFC35_08295 [Streptomyces sp. FBKL.4005]BCM70370.1 hypothetical protein EASAB2608_05704 [Streptomyces sp. EAS-AB2608]
MAARLGDHTGASVLLVGTGRHDERSDLPDVAAVSRTLVDLREMYVERCGLPRSAVTVVHDPANVEAFGQAVAEAAESAEGLLLVHYVGHGLVAEDGTLHLATAGSVSRGDRVRFTALPYDVLRACVAGSAAGARIVVLDCCYSGLAVASGTLGPDRADAVTGLARIAGALVLTATGGSTPALAPQGDRHTAFSGALLRLLTTGLPGGPPVFTLDEVHRQLVLSLTAAGLPKPRRALSGDLGGLVVADNPAWTPAEAASPPDAPRDPGHGTRPDCPYKGLDAFTQDDERLFFGRDRLVTELLTRLRECAMDGRPLAVLGPSGAGKSSVLGAGLLPALVQGRLRVAGSAWWPRRVVTPTGDPVGVLAAVVEELTGTPAEQAAARLRADPGSFGTLLLTGRQERLVLVVDQFEELFNEGASEADRLVFVRALVTATGGGSPAPTALVVLCVRADFYDRCAAFPELAPALENRPLTVRAMRQEEVRDAITKPAAVVGRRVDPDLVEVLLNDLGEGGWDTGEGWYEPGRLPLLSYALSETWERGAGAALSVADYLRTGGISRALSDRADEALDSLDEAGRDCARRLLLRLVHLDEDTVPTRRRLHRDRLLASLPDPAAAQAVLDAFGAARLITQDGADSHATVQIVHDALLREWHVLRGWLKGDQAGLLLEHRLLDDAERWAARDREPGLLYDGAPLAAAEHWAAADPDRVPGLPPVAQEFLAAGTRRRRRRRRVRNLVTTALALLLVATATAGGLAYQQRREALREARASAARSMVSKAELLRDSDPRLALQLGAAAHRLDPDNPATRASLHETLTTSRYAASLDGFGDEPTAVALSPDGRTLAAATADGRLRFWDVTRAARPKLLKKAWARGTAGARTAGGAVSALAWRPDGKFLAAGGPREMTLWDTSDRRAPKPRSPLSGFGTPVVALAWSADGTRLAMATLHVTLLIDLDDPRVYIGLRHESEPYDLPRLALSPDGDLLVTGDGDDSVQLWDVTGTKAVRRGPPLPPVSTEEAPVTAVALSSDGGTLAVGTRAGEVGFWSVRNRRAPERLYPRYSSYVGLADQVTGLAFADEDTRLVIASQDGTVQLAQVSGSGFERTDRPLVHGAAVTSVSVAARRDLAVTGGADGRVVLWDMSDRGLPRPAGAPLAGHHPRSTVGHLSLGGSLLASSADDGKVLVWDVSARARPQALPPVVYRRGTDVSAPPGSALSPDGRRLATSGGTDSTQVVLWRAGQGSFRAEGAPLTGHRSRPQTFAWSPDGRRLVTGDAEGVVIVWRVSGSGAPVRTATLKHPRGAFDAVFSASGRRLATIGGDGKVSLWDMSGETGRPRGLGGVDSGQMGNRRSSMALSPDGRLLAVGHTSASFSLWDVTDPARARRLARTDVGHIGPVGAIAFSPDGSRVATGSVDGALVLWDVTDRSRPRRIGPALYSRRIGFPLSMLFLPGGRTLAVQGISSVDLWDLSEVASPGADLLPEACARLGGASLDRAAWKAHAGETAYVTTCRGADG